VKPVEDDAIVLPTLEDLSKFVKPVEEATTTVTSIET
jgi:hypothetical protein